ncbi:unnamed protein product [Alopecurus aequalis]
MDSTMFIFGIIGNIISVLVILSPIPTFRRIVSSRSTEEFQPAPYVLTLLNSLLWLYYGVTKPDGLLIVMVNGFGAIVEAIYVVLFLVYATDHAARVKTAMWVVALDIGFFGLVFATTTFAIGGLDMKIMITGFICAFLNVLMYGSPLAAMVPNGIGFFLGGIQLVIYAVYKNNMVESQNSDEVVDNGWRAASAPLLSSSTSRHGQNNVASSV